MCFKRLWLFVLLGERADLDLLPVPEAPKLLQISYIRFHNPGHDVFSILEAMEGVIKWSKTDVWDILLYPFKNCKLQLVRFSSTAFTFLLVMR